MELLWFVRRGYFNFNPIPIGKFGSCLIEIFVIVVMAVFPSPLSTYARNQDDPQPPVSWVNPQLPDGPGLAHHVLASKIMNHDVGYVVWTPKDYDDSGTTRYPVIYFLHGMGGNEASDSAGFSELAARGINAGTLQPAICVFPNGGRSGYRGEVEKMIIEELIPLIDKNYPTKAEARSRAVAGFSMGGAGAVRLSMIHPEMFCVAGSWGGGMWRDADTLLAAAEKEAETLKSNHFAVLLINGDQDRPEAFTALADKLILLEIEHLVVILKDTPHNLGLYYQHTGDRMIQFLGDHLKNNVTPIIRP
jgi:endo-1,4-beta-xylanase